MPSFSVPWRSLLLGLIATAGIASAQSTPASNVAPAKKGQIISLAPEATLANGIDDIDSKGNCLREVERFCSKVQAGEGRLASCISDKIAEAEAGEAPEGSDAVTDACREDVYQYRIARNSNVNANIPLAKACKVDAEKFCNVTWMFGYKAGQVIACLRDIKDRLSPGCQKEVFNVQLDAAEDYRADAELYEACKNNAAVLCRDVKPGGGRIQACLRDQRPKLSMLCEEALYRQEKENADDIRLSVRLYVNCRDDKRKFCQDVEPGMARVKECLEAHRTHPGFSAICKKEIDAMLERRVEDFALDSRLRTACNEDIYDTCAYIGDLDNMGESDDSNIIKCLQDYIQELKNPACKQQVLKYKELASEDIRFNMPLAKACFQDRHTYCGNVPPGSAKVIRCLMNMREKLSKTCRAVLFDEEVKFSQNIDFQFPMKKACSNEMQMYCKNVPHGETRIIRCLQDNKRQKDFSKECKAEVNAYEKEAASDYRLNYRLSKSCKSDIASLCSRVCSAEEGQVCGGAVLRCLTDRRQEIKDSACQQEVLYYLKMEVSDYRNDLILATACRQDVEQYCDKIEPGEGRVHECLRGVRDKLSESCRKEELLLEQAEAENIELKPGILRVCKDERQVFCKGVIPGQARMFRCLAEKMGDPDFGETCRQQIVQKLLRRQANWKLDPPLRKACKDSVQQLCADVERVQQEKGLVYMCMVRNYEDLDTSCQKELGRALHMAFFVWVPGAILTAPCDTDIQRICLARRPNMDQTPGAIGSCLADVLEEMSGAAPPTAAGEGGEGGGAAAAARADALAARKPNLSDECRVLADIAQPPDLKQAFEASLTLVVLTNQLSAMEDATGVRMMNRDRYGKAQSLTLTGWTALAGIAALLIIIIWGTGYAWSRYRGAHHQKDYTLVVKKGYR